MKSISVVIPNYNGKQLLEKNLPAVFAALKNVLDYEVIVADDASIDDSVKYIESNWQNVFLVKNTINGGFSKNINSGFKVASKELVLALNSDVLLSEDYFVDQFKYFESPETFGVMGNIYNNGKLIDAAKYPVWKAGKLVTTLNVEILSENREWIPTLFLSGANALMERKKLMQLNGMDEIYSPFYMEDVDLSVRAWRMGWKCYYDPKSNCNHIISSTIDSNNKKSFVKFISKRNKLIFHHIHLSGYRRLFWQTEIVFNLLYRWLSFSCDYYKIYVEFKSQTESKNKRNEFPFSLQTVTNQILTFYKALKIKLF
ncbi:MAG: glycosyltransferase family 2 protein [Bacteroidota bacterium]